MNLIAVGLNHRTAPIEIRERLFFTDDEIQKSLAELTESMLNEAVLFSTCNRTELYGLTGENVLNGDTIVEYLIRTKNASDVALPVHFYTFFSCGAVHHLFKMTSGADSMVIGDIQILGQVKDAYALARKTQTTGIITHKLFENAFHVGKRVRTETELCEGAISISYAAVELAGKIFDDLGKKRALLIGAGETGELTAKHLIGRGIGSLVVVNRTRSKAEEIVSQLGGSVVDFESISSELTNIDIIISSISTPGFVMREVDLRRVMRERSNDPLFIIDIGMPRNIDPAAKKIENVFLYDIDTLNRMIDQNLDKRKTEIPKVNRIIFEELSSFHRWFDSLQVSPTIQQLHEVIESIRSDEVQKHINRFAESDRKLVELLTKRIVNKILHTPVINLRNGNGASDEEILKKISTIRHLFGLEHKSHDT
ncbi:MAG: glutamyl-tRNA reductase [Bacteroidota bacterium]